MCLLLHHLTEPPETFEKFDNPERARRYQDLYWETFSARAEKIQQHQARFSQLTAITRSLGDRLVVIGEQRNILIHGIHSLAVGTPVIKFRNSKKDASGTLDTFPADVRAFDDLAEEMGAATDELIQLVFMTRAGTKAAKRATKP